MNLPMPSLTKAPNGDWFARKVIPANLRQAYAVAHGVSREARFRMPGSASEGEAKRAYGEWLADVEGRVAALRATANGTPITLSQRDLYALADQWYLWFVGQHEMEPGRADQWEERYERYEDVLEADGTVGHPDEDDRAPTGMGHRRRIRARLTELSRLPSFLAQRGTVLSTETLDALLDEALPGEFVAALARLRKLTLGDYSPDERPQRFPNAPQRVPSPAGVKLAGWTSWEAFAAWVNEADPQPSTVNRWRGVFKHLDEFLGHRDVALVIGEDAVAWKDKLVAGRAAGPRTIRDIWLTAARTVFNYVKAQKKIAENPFSGVKVAGSRNTQPKGEFKDEDAVAILRATSVPRSPRISAHLRAAVRWVPWLCAYTGSRPGEMTQLRKEDVEQHKGGFWLLRIRADAGTVKGQIDRTVVLHEHLEAQGFLAFVQQAAPGPLFYGPSRKQAREPDPLNPARAPYVVVRQKLADWVRNDVGVKDAGVSPNHAWRHTFKRRAARAGIEQRIRDAFCGHSDGRVGAIYETPTVEDLAEAIKKFPRYEIAAV